LVHLITPSQLDCEIKGGAAVHFTFGPNSPGMAVNDPLHGGQSDSGTFEFVGGMKPLERPK